MFLVDKSSVVDESSVVRVDESSVLLGRREFMDPVTVSTMCLIQPLKFRTLEMWCFKISHFQAPCLQTGVFQMGITVASGHCV